MSKFSKVIEYKINIKINYISKQWQQVCGNQIKNTISLTITHTKILICKSNKVLYPEMIIKDIQKISK